MFAAKRAFIDVAEQELADLEVKVNTTRISAMTGMNRNDVSALRDSGDEIPDRPLNVLGRVISRWQKDKRFLSKSGRPKVLACGGEYSEFAKLVKLESQHAHASSTLFELERIGAVERTEKGAQLKVTEYLAESVDEAVSLLARDLDALFGAVEQNIRLGKGTALHLHTEYDNVRMAALPDIRKWVREEGKAFHKRIREHLAQYDLDVSPLDAESEEQGGGKVVVGAFHFQSEASPVD